MMHFGGGSTEAQTREIDFLRVVTCGSVDDGKSTLIGRLLYDLRALTEDQLTEIHVQEHESPDFSRILDGLAAEREQGITIDVAYRSFSTERRRFLLADVPGHEQYTRNMITGASVADVALLTMDVRKGIVAQTRRHTYLAWLLGIRSFIVAINKMDLVDYEEGLFRRVAVEYERFLASLGRAGCWVIPVSARFGDNIATPSPQMRWFAGPTVSEALHQVQPAEDCVSRPFRFPVQSVNRSGRQERAYSGLIVSGQVRVGDRITIQPSEQAATVVDIFTYEGSAVSAVARESISIVLDKDVDIGRGHVLCAAHAPALVADVVQAKIIWMSDAPLVRGRSYRVKIGTRTVPGQVVRVQEKLDVDTLELAGAEALSTNEIGNCTVRLDEPVACDKYDEHRDTGGFILIDRVSNDTVAAGLIQSGELHFGNIPWQTIDVTKASRSALKNHRPAVLWFTGIPGAGKSTIANLVEKMLHAKGRHTYLLDGDNIRHGLTRDLGFSDADRVENVRRVAEVARLMADAGLIVLVALISPFRAERRAVRERIGEDFVEIFVDTPVAVAEARDIKGHYRKARQGEIAGFTGVGGRYETPQHPELHIDTTRTNPEDAAETIVQYFETLRT